MRRPRLLAALLASVACGCSGTGSGTGTDDGGTPGGMNDASSTNNGTSPTLAGCSIFPANHIFNTPIDSLPAHASSAAFLTTIGTARNLHLDLGNTVDQQSSAYYGIPWNVVKGGSITWPKVTFFSADGSLSWNTRSEAD